MMLSIITVNKNNEGGLERTIHSVIEQEYKDWEYLVIDGASTDGSVSLLKKYNDQIRYWVSETDSGIYNAMNKGIERAKGEYCLFLNSGDVLYDPKAISRLFEGSSGEDIIYSDIVTCDGREEKRVGFPDTITAGFLFSNYIAHPGMLIKRELFPRIGMYDEKYRICADYDFMLKAFCKYNVSYKHVNEITAKFPIDGISSDPRNFKRIDEERQLSFKCNFPTFYEDYCNYRSLYSDKLVRYFFDNRMDHGIRFFLRLYRKIFKRFPRN